MQLRAVQARAQGKLKRALARAPLLESWADRRYDRALAQHAPRLQDLGCVWAELVATMKRDMVATLDGATLIPADVLHEARWLCQELARDDSAHSTIVCSPSALARAPSVYAWGLADTNLDLAESYIELPVRYLGVSFKRERADAASFDTRQWHLDVEDRRMLKLIVYLDAVDEESGPFEYLDRATTLMMSTKLDYTSGFVDDARLERVVARDAWRTVLGPPLTTVVVDTCRLMHRARPPRVRDRYSMSFSYCSARPTQLFPEYLPPRAFVASLASQLSARQRSAAAHA
ncbi:MAG TPA: hypothetical protein VFX59_31770 [Polyangiales bacterium]|nr:hypothetical protein [Polyangiales bacterium]